MTLIDHYAAARPWGIDVYALARCKCGAERWHSCTVLGGDICEVACPCDCGYASWVTVTVAEAVARGEVREREPAVIEERER